MQTLLEIRSAGPERRASADLRADMESNVQFDATLAALLAGEIDAVHHFQPIVDLRRGVVAGYEALARFPAAMGGAPDVCFNAAGLRGKRVELEGVFSRAALASRRFLPPDCFLSINVSPAYLCSREWDAVLDEVVDLSGTIIEITEEESISDYVPIRARLSRIRSMGGAVAVDDACAGYASLQHVLEIKPSFIKLDRALIRDCYEDRAKSVLIEMMGRAANRLDAWIVAEGMETQQELGELLQLGVPLGQGYFLGRPSAAMRSLPEDIGTWIRSHVPRMDSDAKLAPHVESCPVRPTREAAVQLIERGLAAMVVVIDQWNRPIEIHEQHPMVGLRVSLDPMKVQVSSDPAEALQRALTRTAVARFDPFAVIDEQGGLQGVIRVDRLMTAVLNNVTAS